MGLRKIKINVLILSPIIWGFFIFNTYGQKIGKPSVSLNNYIYVEIPKLRMIDVLEKIEIEDLNKKKTFIVRCHENDYSIDTEENEGGTRSGSREWWCNVWPHFALPAYQQ